MFNTFNMGVGMTIAVAKADADAALALLRERRRAGAYILGEIVPGEERRGCYGKDSRCWSPAGAPICRPSWMPRPRGSCPTAQISLVVASHPDAYALERAEKAGVPAPVSAQGQGKAHRAVWPGRLLELLHSHGIELVVLAGFLTILPENVIQAYPKPDPQHPSRR